MLILYILYLHISLCCYMLLTYSASLFILYPCTWYLYAAFQVEKRDGDGGRGAAGAGKLRDARDRANDGLTYPSRPRSRLLLHDPPFIIIVGFLVFI